MRDWWDFDNSASDDNSASCKGLKAGKALVISGGSITIDAQDDALHTDGDMTISGGECILSTGDDGAHAALSLTVLGGKKLEKFDLANETAAELAVHAVNSRDLFVQSVEAKPASRNPWAPFMTSTLQQEASRKFGMGAKACMSAAQRLYEAGYITYMRTDGIDMAPEAVMAARDEIKRRFGEDYVPSSPRMYKNKAKNASVAGRRV